MSETNLTGASFFGITLTIFIIWFLVIIISKVVELIARLFKKITQDKSMSITAEENSEYECSYCKQAVSENDTICPNCGAKL